MELKVCIEKQVSDSNKSWLTIYMGVSVYRKNHGRANLKANKSTKHPLCNIKTSYHPATLCVCTITCMWCIR
ncbi:hypothetical protein BDV38DRAFT_131398 [Aspergillus pseudotamarii]|uniref:Uncharacterized protein n=1 Tax=Aspergillus pseudotamarii TaxID=132259 RepID=A0A5N6SM01_ASPPS|nr:uncharacterized protein BDV38DRAFT_131398 [Aspergillus pseudotamarii]KAE8135738.1 hypothetical protein BDV38DRAFT_131398 [Aspergillus pseudotamarii]